MIKLLIKRIFFALFFLLYTSQLLAVTTLTLWQTSAETAEVWTQIAKELNVSHKNIKLKVVTFEHDELKRAIIRSSFRKNPVDILLMPSDWLGYNNIMNFSKLPEKLITSETLKNTVNESRFEGDLLGIPFSQGNHLLFMYNKALVNKPASTWNELIENNEQLKKKGVSSLALFYDEIYWFMPFLNAFGGSPVDQDKVTLNTSAMIAAIKYYKRLAELNITDNTCTYQCISSDFYKGKYAYSFQGSWAYQEAKKALGKNFGLAPFPTLNGQKFNSMRGNHVLTFPQNSFYGAKNDALVIFSHFIQQKKYQQLMFDKSGIFPVNKKVMNAIKSRADNDLLLSIKQFNQSNLIPSSMAIIAVWDGILKGFSMYMKGEITAVEAAAYMQKSVERELEILKRKRD